LAWFLLEEGVNPTSNATWAPPLTKPGWNQGGTARRKMRTNPIKEMSVRAPRGCRQPQSLSLTFVARKPVGRPSTRTNSPDKLAEPITDQTGRELRFALLPITVRKRGPLEQPLESDMI
jgi:hypothetical protein